MAKQAIVIGLGHFGLSLVRALSERSVEVLAVDVSEDRVRLASTFAAEAVSFDATDEEALSRTSPARRDLCICAIGEESRESSIICTALLRQMGAPRVISRASDELHERILKLVGAHQVVNPERQFGENFASQVLQETVTGELDLGDGLVISEIKAPEMIIGHSLSKLQLPRRFGVTVVAIRRDQKIRLPEQNESLKTGDGLIVVAREGAVSRLMERR